MTIKVIEYSVDRCGIFNAGDDLDLATAVLALADVDLKHPLQSLRPTYGLRSLGGGLRRVGGLLASPA